jgi:hypothetical protein
VERREVAVVAALEGPVPLPQLPTVQEPPVVLEELTRFLEGVLHMHKEATEVRVAIAPTERLVRRTEVTAAGAVMEMPLQMAATEGRE